MKVAITGSSGLIGRALVDRLTASGHRIVRLVRTEVPADDQSQCYWETGQGVQQLDKLQDVQVVVHLAGRSIGERRWTKREKELIYQSRVPTTQRLCASLARLPRPLPLFISASAIGIYGDCGQQVVTERMAELQASNGSVDEVVAKRGEDFLVAVARQWEFAAQALLDRGTPAICARFGVVLSPDGGALAKMLPLFRWNLGSRLGSGRQYWSWIALDDVVEGLAWMIARHESYTGWNAYNLTAPEPVTNAEFTRVLASHLQRLQFLPVPKFALRWGLGEMADAALFSSCRAVPERLLAEGFQFKHASLKSALAAMDL